MNIMITFALRGAGDTRFVTWLTFGLGFVLLVLPTYYLMNDIVLPYYPKGERIWAMYWVWGIATAYLMVQCAAFTARFVWGPWRSMRVIEPKVDETLPTVTPALVADMPFQPSYSEGWKEETSSVPPL
jgi:MATE family multidrug resistance protein